jgi:hypothetical protein
VTPRLRLRRLTAADLDALHALDSDPAVMRYINGGLPVSREVFAATLLPVLLATGDTPPGYATESAAAFAPRRPRRSHATAGRDRLYWSYSHGGDHAFGELSVS